MLLRIIIVFNSLLISVDCFMQPFVNWHCIEHIKNIDTRKPYAFNIGELPLVTWFNETSPITTINICKHMGSKLDNGDVSKNKGCLTCPYHGFQYTEKDSFGKSIIFQDKLWWSYNPIHKNPPSIPFYDDKNYATTAFTLDMDANIKDCIFNTFDIYHFAHVHSNIIGTFEPPKNYKYYKLGDDKIGISYKYKTNEILSKIKKNLDIFDNFQLLRYPYTSSSILSLSSNNEKFIVHVDMLPIALNKTRWIITLKHNFWKSYFDKLKIEYIMKFILSQDQEQMSKQASKFPIMVKNDVIFRQEEHFNEMRKIYNSYKYPDMYNVMLLYEYHKNIK